MKPLSVTRHGRRAFLVLTAVGTLGPRQLGAQDPGGFVVVDTPPDSAAVREEAEIAQAAFERTRIRHLPWTRSSPPRPCDEIVGRFCFWHDPTSRWIPPPEHPNIRRERERLLDRLATAARAVPGDGWITGQRVRYLVEAERIAEAVAVARDCRAARSWCRALEGYVLHSADDFAAAESVFDRALAAMPEADRASWTDLVLLLDRELARGWKKLGPEAREAFARRLWWLADPFWSTPGNERRSEHFARLVLDRLQERARSPYDVAWGRDLRELTVRYGWPIGWERVRTSSGALGGDSRPGIVGHDVAAGRSFVPSNAVFAEPLGSRVDDWRLDARAPRETYTPASVDSVVDLEPLITIFRRGESARVVAGWETTSSKRNRGPSPSTETRVTGTTDPDARAVVVVASDPDARPWMARILGSAKGPLEITVPWRSAILSLETNDGGLAGRARYGLSLDEVGRPPLSDLLLLDRPVPLPADLDDAAPRARSSNRFHPGERLGLYFEIYPPTPGGESARLALGLRDERGGFWHRIGTAFGIGDASIGDVAVAWSEELTPGALVHPRALVVDLPDMPEGSYVVELEISFPHGPAHRAERSIFVSRDP